MNDWLVFLLLSLTTYRVTRLTVRDDFPPLLWARTRVQNVRPRRDDGEYWWGGELVSCHWCASGWIALVIVIVTALTVGLPAPLLWWPAVWGLGALTYHIELRIDERIKAL